MPNSLVAEKNRLEFHISTDKVLNFQVKLDLFALASSFHLIFELAREQVSQRGREKIRRAKRVGVGA